MWGGPRLTIPGGTQPGTYHIGILVDSQGWVTETDETNNYISTPIIVATTSGAPDLVVTSLTHSPANPTTLDTITVEVGALQGVVDGGLEKAQGGPRIVADPV